MVHAPQFPHKLPNHSRICCNKIRTYTPSFRDFTSTNPGLPAPAEHGTRVRRRRFTRIRVLIDEDTVASGGDGGGLQSAMAGSSRSARSFGGGSVGSCGSRRLTGRASVGFALAPLEESSLKKTQVEVVSF